MAEKLEVLKVTVRDGFYILIIPTEESNREFFLKHDEYGHMDYMFTLDTTNNDECIEIALANADDYIDDYIDTHLILED